MNIKVAAFTVNEKSINIQSYKNIYMPYSNHLPYNILNHPYRSLLHIVFDIPMFYIEWCT